MNVCSQDGIYNTKYANDLNTTTTATIDTNNTQHDLFPAKSNHVHEIIAHKLVFLA